MPRCRSVDEERWVMHSWNEYHQTENSEEIWTCPYRQNTDSDGDVKHSSGRKSRNTVPLLSVKKRYHKCKGFTGVNGAWPKNRHWSLRWRLLEATVARDFKAFGAEFQFPAFSSYAVRQNLDDLCFPESHNCSTFWVKYSPSRLPRLWLLWLLD